MEGLGCSRPRFSVNVVVNLLTGKKNWTVGGAWDICNPAMYCWYDCCFTLLVNFPIASHFRDLLLDFLEEVSEYKGLFTLHT